MALGTSIRPNQKRNDIVKSALLDVKASKVGENADGNLLRLGVDALNAILREEDQDKTGQKRFLTSLKTAHLFLEVGRTIYTTAEGLAADIHELHTARWRDSKGGERELDFISPRQYETLAKLDTGDPCRVYLKKAADPANHQLLVWPIPLAIAPSTVPPTTASVVLGTDGVDYVCILGHTATAARRPVTGTDYTTYWQAKTTTAGAAWVTGTAYTTTSTIRYLYKRPLFNFDTLDDDPDVADGWANYLRWRLAVDLSPKFDVALDRVTWFERQIAIAENRLFPSNEAKTTDYHNKTEFF